MNVQRHAAAAVDPDLYLAGANACFGHWGDAATFDWVFRDDAELLFIHDAAGRAVASSGITWRTLPDGRAVAIITGAWTLPQARGMGVFSALIEATRLIASEKNAVMLGFGRMDNTSGRRLQAAGSDLHPTFYCRSVGSPVQEQPLQILEPDAELFPTGFRYTPAAWRVQFLQRPHASIECLGRRGEWAAILERTPEFDRVHALSHIEALPLLAARAHAHGRRLFWFTTQPPTMECEWTDGFLGTFPPSFNLGEFQNGDRM
ncbi:MAG: hypothetical protein ABI779_13200 [Acidobacteriota bacterium]